jgi:signal transduction histidine kinase
VFLNLIINAAHAVADRHGPEGRGTIRLSTCVRGEQVVVAIADDGCGIPEAAQPRIFEPFFTTKEVGRGTGQGLAISRAIVADRHGGSLSFQTAPGVGTTFTVELPLSAKPGECVESIRSQVPRAAASGDVFCANGQLMIG